MKAEKEIAEGKVDVSGIAELKNPCYSRKIKIAVVILVTAITLIVGAAVFLAFSLLTKSELSKSLVEVNLEEGDALTYRVEQRFEVSRQSVQKDIITSIVGIRVVNKTTDAYWFLLKINTTFKDEDNKVKSTITVFFRVRLQVTPRKGTEHNYTGSETSETFELHGYPHSDGEFIRYLHGVLYQLLPTVRRDLYEDVDGQTDKKLKPEKSPLFPGPVRMHRQANTKQSDKVLIKNHFNKSDLSNSSSDIDLDVHYTDSAAINKSNGMVSESNVYLSEQLHFGEPIKTKDGHDVTMMNVTLYSHVTLIENDIIFFEDKEIKAIKTHLFVKLVVPTTDSIIVDKKPPSVPKSSNSSSSLNSSIAAVQQLSTQAPTIKRSRRAVDAGHLTLRNISSKFKIILRQLKDLRAPKENTFTLFEKKLIGINVKAESKVWFNPIKVGNNSKAWKIGCSLSLEVGSIKVPVYSEEYNSAEIEQESEHLAITRSKKKEIPLCFRVYILRLCVEFSLGMTFTIHPPRVIISSLSANSSNSEKLTIEMHLSSDVEAGVQAYALLLFVKAGVYVEGTIIKAVVPVALTYEFDKPVNSKRQDDWCLETKVQLTFFELEAGIFYQFITCRWYWFWLRCYWGSRNTLYSFEHFDAIRHKFDLVNVCF